MKKLTYKERAEAIIQALPFIKCYNGKVVVVKYGGNAMTDEVLKEKVMEDLVLLWLIGIKIVLVHGGGPEINDLMDKFGKVPEFVDGLRVTDKETVSLVQMALAGKVNKDLVNLIEVKGGRSVGLSGIDGRLIQAEVLDERLGYVGKVTKINTKPILALLDDGYIPVISTIACDKAGNIYNINGDSAAAAIAGALDAERMIMMTNTPGILKDAKDPESTIPEIDPLEAGELFEQGIISGGMIPKVECCIDAISAGVKNCVILDGTDPHSILMELLTNAGVGTLIKGAK